MLETTGAINVQVKASEEDTILCFESLFNSLVQMITSFNSLLIKRVQCVSSGNILPEFFSSPLYVHEFFWHDSCVAVQEFFFLCICTCRIYIF